MIKEPPIIKTNEWGAIPPRIPVTVIGRPTETIFHHTAGHHPEINLPQNESRLEAVRYARDIQHFHMFSRGWIDSGHNFLVCRNGLILVGRHMSYTQVHKGRMVESAHCVGHNNSPGVEHEHLGSEALTDIQVKMSAWLYAWIHECCKIRGIQIFPHSQFNLTDCPSPILRLEIPGFRHLVNEIRQKGHP